MKRLTLFLIAILSVLYFVSCNDDDGNNETIWYTYGTYHITDTVPIGYIIKADDGKILIPDKASNVNSNIKDSSRVLPYYYKKSESDSTIVCEIINMDEILTKGILQLTEDNQDSIGNNGIIVDPDKIWFSEHHLNVVFSYYGYYTVHFINLVKPIGEQTDSLGYQILEFKHNDNNDPLTYLYTNVVSFDMGSIQESGQDSINILFKSVSYYGDTLTWRNTFYYSKNKSSTIKESVSTSSVKKAVFE